MLTLHDTDAIRHVQKIIASEPDKVIPLLIGNAPTIEKGCLALICSVLLERAKQQNEFLKIALALAQRLNLRKEND